MSQDSNIGTTKNEFNTVVHSYEAQTPSVPEGMPFITSDEYKNPTKIVYIQHGKPYIKDDIKDENNHGKPYIKDDNNQPVEIAAEDYGINPSDCVQCPAIYGSENFVQDLERLALAHGFEEQVIRYGEPVITPVPAFKGSIETAAAHFNGASGGTWGDEKPHQPNYTRTQDAEPV